MLQSLLDANGSREQLLGYVHRELRQEGNVNNRVIWDISFFQPPHGPWRHTLGLKRQDMLLKLEGSSVCVCGYEDLIAVSMATRWHSAVPGSLLMACQRSKSRAARAADNQRPQEREVKWFHGLQVWQVGWLQTSGRPSGSLFLSRQKLGVWSVVKVQHVSSCKKTSYMKFSGTLL